VGLLAACTWAAAQDPWAPDLARRLGCFACHSLGGWGGKTAAPLDRVAARLAPAQLHIVLTHPRKLHAGAKMPSYAYLPAEERQALVDFLQSLK
jgi:mono/diheme cytochrome c family protein